MLYGRHIYAKAADVEQATMCTYPKSDHAPPYWKYVLQCCNKFPCIKPPDQETDNQYS